MINKVKRELVSLLLGLCALFTVLLLNASNNNNTIDDNIDVQDTVIIDNNDSLNYIKDELVSEVSRYIYKQAPNAHDEIANHIVSACIEHDIDICFAMAQTQIETNFGTLGAGRHTSKKSLFGVSKRYGTYEDAVYDYTSLLRTRYLVRGKTEHDLMRNYINKNGHRYAEHRGYEISLRSTYKTIKNSTDIVSIQRRYKNKNTTI